MGGGGVAALAYALVATADGRALLRRSNFHLLQEWSMVRRVWFFAVHGFINKFAKGVFEPSEVKILTGAFDDAWARLKASKAPFADEEYAAAARTILAKRIIKLAKEGERDRSKLATDGLLYLSQQKMTRSPPSNGVA